MRWGRAASGPCSSTATGTLIRDVGHLCRADQVEILPRVPEALRLVKDAGFKVVVVTNQSVIARGRLTEAQLTEIHRQLFHRLAEFGAQVDSVYYCPHHPTEGFGSYRRACDCRKPNTGMIRLGSSRARPGRVSLLCGGRPTHGHGACRTEWSAGDLDPPGQTTRPVRASGWVTRVL